MLSNKCWGKGGGRGGNIGSDSIYLLNKLLHMMSPDFLPMGSRELSLCFALLCLCMWFLLYLVNLNKVYQATISVKRVYCD